MRLHLHATLWFSIICTFVSSRTIDRDGCIRGASYFYAGKISHTAEGYECQRWDTNKPHEVKHKPADGGGHNYCRNPDKDIKGTWCYTTDPHIRWGYCNVPKCPSETVVIWNSFDSVTNTSFFSQVNADPEFMSLNSLDKSGSTMESEHTYVKNAQYKALETDYDGKRIYFTDVRGNYLGIYSMETQTTERYLHGIVQNIEAISYDSVTGNFYWTDSKMKWVMGADPSLKSYSPVYRSDPYTPNALEVHSMKRLLIFSTYLRQNSEMIDANIITTDLAGKNKKVLFSYPEVVKVIALTVDYAEDRIYWIDSLGYGSKVSSSGIDGSNKIQHYNLDESSFYDLAVVSEYIYISDLKPRKDFFEEIHYKIFIVTKRSDQVASYTFDEEPFGIGVYGETDFRSKSKLGASEKCSESCSGICFPRMNAKSQCTCSLGYQLTPKTSCRPKMITDEYLLVVDADGRAYQISMASGETYSRLILGDATRVSTVAMDSSNQYTYISDIEKMALRRGRLDGSKFSLVAKAHAKTIQIDPLTGNIFYSDFAGKTITFSTPDGSVKQVIVKPDSSSENSDIKMFALDIKNKYLYWTDTYSQEGAGKVMRCRFDGSQKVAVLDNLHQPHGITIDVATNRLYVLESKKAALYEISLVKLSKIKLPMAKSQCKKYDLLSNISHRRFLLTEVKIHKGVAYLIDEEQPQLQRFNLSRGPDSLEGFGPAIFHKASSLSVYSNGVYHKSIKFLPSRCKKDPCLNPSLCIDVTGKKSKCVNAPK